MKSVLLIACLCAAGTAALGYQEPATKGSIGGQVVNADTGAPVRNATVTITATSGRPMRPGQPPPAYYSTAVDVDEQGRFAFRDLNAGGYQLRAQRRGAQNNNGNGITVFVGEQQQLKGVTLKFAGQSVISGKVVDQDGEPLQNAQVSLMRLQSIDGRQWMTAASAQTSDLGEYRMVVPNPGSYVVAAAFRDYMMRSGFPGQTLPSGPELAYVTTYYPSAVDMAQAVKVTAGASGEVRNIDIKLKKVPTVRIRGRVIDPSPTSNRTASVTLRSKINPSMMNFGASTMMNGTDGEFEISGVQPGSYTLVAQKYLTDGTMISSDTPSISAWMEIQAGAKSIEGLTLKLAPNKDVQGNIKVDGTLSTIPTVIQIAANSADAIYYGPTPSARNITGTAFTLKNVAAGRYVVNVSLPPTAAYVKSVRYGGREIPTEGVDLTTGEALEVTLAGDGGRVEGTVTGASGKPLQQGLVFLSGSVGSLTPPSPVRTDNNGEFRFRMLRPGEYKVVAVEGLLDMRASQNLDVIKTFESRAKTAKVEAGGLATISLDAVPAVESAGIATPAPVHVKGSVEGQVLDGKTGLPVTGAVVKLGTASFVRPVNFNGAVGVVGGYAGGAGITQPPGLTAQTDDQGRFVFHEVEPAAYQLGAEHQGFISGTYIQGRNNLDPGLVVGEGQPVRNVVLKLAPQGVIAGKVLDEDGSPMERVRIVLLRRTYSRGQVRFAQMAGSTQTDDLGEYRIPNLAAGTYILGARVIRPVSVSTGPLPDRPDMAYPATFFPKALDPAQAKVVALEPGVQASGVDITMRKTPLLRIRGKIVDPSGPLPRNYSLQVWPKGGGTAASALAPATPRDAQGNFEISDLTPGVYTVMARINESARTRLAQQTVEVGDKHVDGVTLELAAAADVTATVSFEDKAPMNFGIFPNLVPADGVSGLTISSGGNDGKTLVYRNVPPIPYTVNVSNLSYNCNCYVTAVRYGGQVVPESGMVLTGGAPLEIVLSAKAGTVEGTVVNSQGNPVPGAVMAILPKEGTIAQLATGTADDRGRFYWPNNAPGEYKLLAWEDIDIASLDDPGILHQFDRFAKSVKLDANGRETLQLTAIPATPGR